LAFRAVPGPANGVEHKPLAKSECKIPHDDLLDRNHWSVTFNGINILRDKTALRRTLGYLPQEFGASTGASALAMLKHRQNRVTNRWQNRR